MVISDQFVQNWYVQLSRPGGRKENMSNKLRTYQLFKKVFQLEYYLTCVNYFSKLSKNIRVSCRHLAIETGRYHKPFSLPVEQRLCSACNLIEDEVRVYLHFESLSPIYREIHLTHADS